MTESKEYQHILEITEAAVDKIAELIAKSKQPGRAVRVAIQNAAQGAGYQTEFMFVNEDEIPAEDVLQDAGPFRLVFDPQSATILTDASVDFNEEKYRGGFRIKYPETIYDNLPASKEWDDPVAVEIQKVIDRNINPSIASHGGWVELLEVKGETAYIEMGGGCKGCAMSYMTLKSGIESAIKEGVPAIKTVLDTTEHAEGTNPYYVTENQGETPF
ncbi:MAG: NifU family protein [Anaerolineales bacterium]|nr:NifU family protein [Anaerolineales bacterium]